MHSVYTVNLSYPSCTYESVLHYPEGFLRSQPCVTCPARFYISALLYYSCSAFLLFLNLLSSKFLITSNYFFIFLCMIYWHSDLHRMSSPQVTQLTVTSINVSFTQSQRCLPQSLSPVMIFARASSQKHTSSIPADSGTLCLV